MIRKARFLSLVFFIASSASCLPRAGSVDVHNPWRHELSGTETPRIVIERYLEEVQAAAVEHRPEWKPIINSAAQSVEISFDVPINPDKASDRRVYEVTIRIVVDEVTNDLVTVTPQTVVFVSEIRDGVIWGTDDSEDRALTYEIQQLLNDIE